MFPCVVRRLQREQGLPCQPLWKKRNTMLWTIAILSIVLWAFGLITSHPMGGFIHLFLLLAVVLVLIQGIHRHRTV